MSTCHKLIQLIMIGIALSTAGCGSNGKWVRTLPETLKPPSNLNLPPTDKSSPRIIAIRWPAVVSQEAKGAAKANYKRYVRLADGYDAPDLSPELMEMLSTFYSGELYWALRRLDPSAVILLEPQMVINTGAELTLHPMTDSAIPVDLELTLLGITSPNSALPLLVDIISVSASTAPDRSPGNCGVLVVTVDTQALAPEPGCISSRSRSRYTHWILDGSVRPAPLPSKSRLALPLSTEQTLTLPAFVEGEANLTSAPMSEYRSKSVTPLHHAAETVAVQPLVADFAAIALSSFTVIRVPTPSASFWGPYVAQYDQGLATKLRSAIPLAAWETRNLTLIRRLYEQELQVRGRRDETIARDIMSGSMGAGLRAARAKAHADYGGKMGTMMLTTATSIIAGGALIQSAGSGFALLSANNSTFDAFNRQMESTGAEYVQRLAPTLNVLERGTFDLLDGAISVSVGDQAALRAALRNIYDRRKYTE